MSPTSKCFGLVMLLSTPLMGAGSAPTMKMDNGAQLYESCRACHGEKGEGSTLVAAPPIAGLPEWYIISTLKKFKHGVRGAHYQDVTGLKMRPMARALKDDKEIKAISHHVAQMVPQKPVHKGIGDTHAGKALYMACAACHGPKGEGNVALKAPPIGKLPDWYISDQLEKFKAGIRGTNPKDKEGASMRPMAMALKDRQAMDDVAAYIASLNGATAGPQPKAHDDHGHH